MECRICLSATDEPVISPCAGCRGSSAAVHFSCVEAFYRCRKTWWDLSCPTCKHDYQGVAAIELGQIGLDEMERCYGEEDPNVAVLLMNLSNVYSAAGNASRQKDLLERALQIQERHFGPEHQAVSNVLTNLGNAYGDLGNSDKKRLLLERALTIKERVLGAEHEEVSVTLTNLGNAYGDLGDLERKRDVLQQALQIREREFGKDHFKVAVTLANLGNAYGSLGDVRKQCDLLLRTLAIEERELGLNHVSLAITLTSLAQAQAGLGESNDALSSSSRALSLADSGLSRPNAMRAEMGLFAALVAAACDQEERARTLWAESRQELRRSIGDHDSSAKMATFTAHALRAWNASGRRDVGKWLLSVADN